MLCYQGYKKIKHYLGVKSDIKYRVHANRNFDSKGWHHGQHWSDRTVMIETNKIYNDLGKMTEILFTDLYFNIF